MAKRKAPKFMKKGNAIILFVVSALIIVGCFVAMVYLSK